MNFDIETPEYEEEVMFWLKKNLPLLKEELTNWIPIYTNVDFHGMLVGIADDKCVVFVLPGESTPRVYYPNEILHSKNHWIECWKIDDIMWFYKEVTGLCSFGMDMEMPFLYQHFN